MSESAFEGKNMLESASEGKRSMLEQCSPALSGLKARSRSDFECSAASKEKEECSTIDFERSVAFRRCKKQARAVISSTQWLQSTLKQRFRAPSGDGACLSSDFERIMRKLCACAVFSNAVDRSGFPALSDWSDKPDL